jgi:phage I-like protein
MNIPILNREFKHPADGWYHLEPKGDHAHQDAGVIQVIDDEAIATIVNRFNVDAAAGKLSHGNEMLVDHEHFKHDGGQETRAYGWLQNLQNRADGIYGKVRWTKTGQAAVDGGDYRFFSTEYDPADLKVLNDGRVGRASHPCRVRPLKLDGLTLTNQPNNRGQRPITNRLVTDPTHNNLADADASAANQAGGACTHKPTKQKMKQIASLLGLAAEAAEESILAAITTIQNRIATLEPLAAENITLKNRVKKLDEDGIAALLAERKITDDKIINRLKPVLAGYPTREERIAVLDDFGFSGGEAAAGHRETVTQPASQQTKLFNRNTKPPAAGKGVDEKNENAEKVQATKIMNRAKEIMKNTPNVSDATAVIMAQNEMAS